MMELTAHLPWFLLSVEINAPDEPDAFFVRTLCIAWDRELADVLGSLEAERVKGIVCLTPGWQSPNGQWSAREILEVWTCSSEGGDSVLLRDAAGQTFDCGLMPQHVEPMARTLVLRVEPGSREHAPQEKRGTRRSTTPGDGAGRAGKAGA
ncbi:hypothetical protein LXT12_26030 [Pelomonas sp. P7]|uniref:Uncharacterized protein n=1 Tax=Pelomonas caseinilytica TaxID=2906763 RepID=A0ABS8XM67_9BURK|nr:hypothetical protein [Pelomonas sp. P7]MCE4540697.1 hypothetical protein [Pelomonas sp. P7]